MKHTPGPWRVSVEKYPEPRKVKVGTGEDGWWGVASAFGDTQEEAEANARLIAAAPDMLEALTTLVHRVQKMEGPQMLPKSRVSFLLTDALAALEKAGGAP